MQPGVSVTLCCFNSERYLRETLNSIVDQTYKNWELVVVNDGSSDSTADILQEYVDAGWPIVVHNQKNAGLAASRNKALELARGELIALIDHDDLWDPRKLELQVPLFSNPRVGLVYSNTVVIDHSGRELREFLPRSRMFRGEVLVPLFLGQFLACSSAVVRRTAIDEVGPFKTHYKINEEYELFMRLAARYEFDYVDVPLMKWRVHATNATWDFRRNRTETADVLRQALQRHPEIERQLGPRVVKLRMSGFSCTMQQTAWLARPSSMVMALAHGSAFRVLAKYFISLLPTAAIDAVQRAMSWSRRRAVTS